MSEKLNLSDLGLEPDITPAEKAAKGNSEPIMILPNQNENKVQTIKSSYKPTETNNDNPNVLVTPHGVVNNTNNIPTPNKTENIKEFKQLDLAEFAKTHPSKKVVTPYERTKNDMLKKVDDNLERTKKTLTRPGGRIDEAKHKYIDDRYEKLVRRAKQNSSVAEQMRKVNEIMETDPRFDGITEYERRAYILFVVAKDNDTGVNNEYFGINPDKQPRFRSSSEANKELNEITEKKIDDSFIYDANKSVAVNKDQVPNQMYHAPKDDDDLNIEEDKSYDTDVETSELVGDPDDVIDENDPDGKPLYGDGTADEDDIEVELDDEDNQNSDTSEDDDNDPPPSEEQLKLVRQNFKKQVEEALHIGEEGNDIEGFVVSTKPIKLNSALNIRRERVNTSVWPLIYSGKLVEMTPFSGEEIIALNPRVTNISTVAGLKKLFSIIYHHIVEPKKPPFETWLKQIPNYDVNGLLFAVYVANFKDTNYITYECKKKSCSNVFIEKKEIEDMLIFPNDKIKDRFYKIMNKEPISSQYYKSKIVPINKNYAFGFAMNSIYSSLFEPSALTAETREKYNTVINIMPNIDKVYRIDRVNNELIPISFGVVANSLSKTVMRKVKSLDAILKQLTVDERAIVISEVNKLDNKQALDNISYKLPEVECSLCHTVIEEQEAGPFDLLFTRAQLPVLAASIRE